MTPPQPADARALGRLLGRIQALAAGVARRSRTAGRVALVAAPVAWLTLFGRWAFDSVARLVVFLVVLAALALPGVVLVAFARLVDGVVEVSRTAGDELAGLVAETREGAGAAAGLVREPGRDSLARFLAALWRLRRFRDEFGPVVTAAVGSARLFHPGILLGVAAAGLGAGLVTLLAGLGVVLLVL